MTMFDKTLIWMAVLFAICGCAAYWLPGTNEAAFELIKMGFAAAVGFFLGKKADAGA